MSCINNLIICSNPTRVPANTGGSQHGRLLAGVQLEAGAEAAVAVRVGRRRRRGRIWKKKERNGRILRTQEFSPLHTIRGIPLLFLHTMSVRQTPKSELTGRHVVNRSITAAAARTAFCR